MSEITNSQHLDNKIKTLSITLLTKRNGLSRDQFQSYWKDIHGPVCSRLTPLALYVQHHMKPMDTDLLPEMEDKLTSPTEDTWDGFAEIGFFSNEDLVAWLPSTNVLFDDEQNVFQKTVAHYCDAHSFTLKDRSDALMTFGKPDGSFMYWLIRKRGDTPLTEAIDFLTGQVLQALVSSDEISRVRYHILEEHDNTKPNPPAPNVEHFLAKEQQYQFVLELALEDKLAMRQLYRKNNFHRLTSKIKHYFEAIHAHESDGRYTMVYDGNITLAGLRGATNAQLIKEVGAFNQTQDAVKKMMVSNHSSNAGGAGE